MCHQSQRKNGMLRPNCSRRSPGSTPARPDPLSAGSQTGLRRLCTARVHSFDVSRSDGKMHVAALAVPLGQAWRAVSEIVRMRGKVKPEHVIMFQR
jgi:hypothetical protein